MKIEGGIVSSTPIVKNNIYLDQEKMVQNTSKKITKNTHQLKEAQKKGEILPISEDIVLKTIERANKAVMGRETYFKFEIHEKTKEIMVKVMNKENNEIIREIPPEKALDMIAKMWELSGILIDEKL